MSLVLAAGSRRVSIISVNARFGGRGSRNPDGLASKSAASSGSPSNRADMKRSSSPSSDRAARSWPAELGRSDRVETTRVSMDVERHVKLDVVYRNSPGRDSRLRRTGCPSDVRMGRPFRSLGNCRGDQAGAEPIIGAGVNARPWRRKVFRKGWRRLVAAGEDRRPFATWSRPARTRRADQRIEAARDRRRGVDEADRPRRSAA